LFDLQILLLGKLHSLIHKKPPLVNKLDVTTTSISKRV